MVPRSLHRLHNFAHVCLVGLALALAFAFAFAFAVEARAQDPGEPAADTASGERATDDTRDDTGDETAQVDSEIDALLAGGDDLPAVSDAAMPEGAEAEVEAAPVVEEVLPAGSDELATAQFHRELRTVEEDVSSLKERVFRSKATLELLKELVIDAAAAGSRVVLWHVNELGGGYSIESVQYFLDGKNIFSRVDPEGSLDVEREIKLHEQTVTPGTHELEVNMVLRGGGYKVFSYLRSYKFNLQSSYTFKVEQGKISLIRVVADSRGAFKSFVERPRISYDERVQTFREE